MEASSPLASPSQSAKGCSRLGGIIVPGICEWTVNLDARWRALLRIICLLPRLFLGTLISTSQAPCIGRRAARTRPPSPCFEQVRRRSKYACSAPRQEIDSRASIHPIFSKRPSSTNTIHLPQVHFRQIDSISTPNSRAAHARTCLHPLVRGGLRLQDHSMFIRHEIDDTLYLIEIVKGCHTYLCEEL